MAGRKRDTRSRTIDYRRPKVRVRTKPKGAPVEIDMELADQLLEESLTVAGLAHESPKGSCYRCDKKIPPMRKLCGACQSKQKN